MIAALWAAAVAMFRRWWRRNVCAPDTDYLPGGADETLDEALLRHEVERGYNELEAFLAHPSQQEPDL